MRWINLLKWKKGTRVSLVQTTTTERQEKETEEKSLLSSIAECFIAMMVLPNLEIEFCRANKLMVLRFLQRGRCFAVGFEVVFF